MELKTLILGLILSTAAFAVKAGSGLGYLFVKAPGIHRKTAVSLAFMTGYGVVFLAASWVLIKVNLVAHIDVLQGFFKSGMTLHFLLALLLAAWGVRLLVKNRHAPNTTMGWLPLVVPCPVCFCVILLSCSFAGALYPGSPLVFIFLYAGFVLIAFLVALFFAAVIKSQGAAGTFLGSLMLYIAGYFMLSVIVIPQFADLEIIYRISAAEPGSGISTEKIYMILTGLAALAAGFAVKRSNPLRRE